MKSSHERQQQATRDMKSRPQKARTAGHERHEEQATRDKNTRALKEEQQATRDKNSRPRET